MPYKVVVTWETIYDVLNITEYIEIKFGKPRADLFQTDIDKQMSELGHYPRLFPTTGIFYREYEILKKSFSPSIIFYILVESKREIHILRVLREESDWFHILQKAQTYTYPTNT